MGTGGWWDLGASGVGSKVWVLTVRLLEVNHKLDSIRARSADARETRFLVEFVLDLNCQNMHKFARSK